MFSFFDALSLQILVLSFLFSAIIICIAGTKLTYLAEDIAEQTGIGQAITGAIAIGIVTSLSGTIVSFYSAFMDQPALSIGNSIGGLPAQTLFLAIADLAYRKVNLEHASASIENLGQSALLFILLSLPLIATQTPNVTLFGIHPMTPILIIAYIAGLKVVHQTRKKPMWHPRKTPQTQNEDQKEDDKNSDKSRKSIRNILLLFFLLVGLLTLAGFILAQSGIEISARTGLSQTLVGGLFTSISTSLPELVTTLTAVRRNALNLAVGNIIGGNTFDTIFLAGSDIFYRSGSLYHQIAGGHILMIAISMAMTGIVLLGLLRRERKGPAGIGFESMLVIALYILMASLIFFQS